MESRHSWLSFADDTRILLVLLAGAVIAFVVVFVVLLTNASFVERSESKDNLFSTGSAALTLSPSDRPIVDATNMRPGDSRSGDIIVTNDGLPAQVSVTVKGASGLLAHSLELKITRKGSANPSPSYSGKLANADRIELGTQGKGESSTWTFQLTLPSNATGFAGDDLDARFEWEVRTPK